MKQLLIRADDLGYSYAVDLGIVRTIREGARSLDGAHAQHARGGARRALGPRGGGRGGRLHRARAAHQRVPGNPLRGPGQDSQPRGQRGQLKSSRTYREAYKRGEDFVAYDEAVIEIEAQLDLCLVDYRDL